MFHCMYISHFVYHSFIAGTLRFNLQVSLIQRSGNNCCSLCTYLSNWVLFPPTQDFCSLYCLDNKREPTKLKWQWRMIFRTYSPSNISWKPFPTFGPHCCGSRSSLLSFTQGRSDLEKSQRLHPQSSHSLISSLIHRDVPLTSESEARLPSELVAKTLCCQYRGPGFQPRSGN